MNKTRKLDPKVFKAKIADRGHSVRSLSKICDHGENTIRRCIDTKSITIGVGIDICEALHCSFDEAFGPDDSFDWAHIKYVLFGEDILKEEDYGRD